MIRVVIVDDEPAVLETMDVILGSEDDLFVIGTARDGVEALELVERTSPDVVVMDLRLPVLDGVSATRRILELPPPHPGILALTTFATDEMAIDVIRAGASGFCAKTDPPDAIVQAVRTVALGDAIVSPRVLGAMLSRLVPTGANVSEQCTARELEVLGIVAEGALNSEIADRLFITEATVRSHVQSLRSKLGARTRAELVVRAYELGVAPWLAGSAWSAGSNGKG
jgi:DNA-binding NarL/FixJ family response regulator